MGLIKINTRPTRRQLNAFGLMWLVAFGIVGGLVFSRASGVSAAIWGAAIVVPTIGWFSPAFMRIVYVGMAYAAFPIGFVVSHALLAVVYYLVLTPIGLLGRLFGRDPMTRRFEPEARTYWIARDPPESMERHFKQF